MVHQKTKTVEMIPDQTTNQWDRI